MTAQFSAVQELRVCAADAISDLNRELATSLWKVEETDIATKVGSHLEVSVGIRLNNVLQHGGSAFRLAILVGNHYNDLAVVKATSESEEVLRVEVKTMNLDADEGKAHFEALQSELDPSDVLFVMVWRWVRTSPECGYPYISDYFFGLAVPIAQVRDALHRERGGTFVSRANCPALCIPNDCSHHGEPLNSEGKRERITGPTSTPPRSNFGGLLRMLKTDSDNARRIFRKLRYEDDTVHAFVSFLHRHFPSEEYNQYTQAEWVKIGHSLGMYSATTKKEWSTFVRRVGAATYQDTLRTMLYVDDEPKGNLDALWVDYD